ncbi:hypothetical protein ACU62Z_15900 [Klebsiella aerogenes]|uniref:hypothetical protein n=1 Tax=Klebsiella aerogenes TaxID=548 RepID=UPI00044DFB02|nr:hypothetical protein [Klebsiella aerogenes]EUL31966.1 hypothetical protein P851_03433 [Klebsiella aerogenes UCI 48]EUL44778.1 hypothetical protein P850_03433 [Klebsiella aerogenes UCI 47]MEB6076115.1 hypothetical protein [Klebsiella aerogenes]HEJ0334429.1 hypothetical protein [Klebsiella aerogenes]
MAKQQPKESDHNNIDTTDAENQSTPTLVCGIVMPIADIEGYPIGHWRNVHDIICEASADAGFKANLVSSDDDVSVIQKRIVQNLYDNPIVVCDISARNANVMFELGMRLAFDKPTVIIKDERTPYSFDISSIEHLDYPSDLRYQSINVFKERLAGKIRETYSRSLNDPEYTTFLKHFGTFKVAQLDQKEVSETEYLASEIKDIKSLLISLRTPTTAKPRVFGSTKTYTPSEVDHYISVIKSGVASYTIKPEGFSISKTMVEKLIDALQKDGFEIEQTVLSGKDAILHLSSSLTKEEENTFKEIIVTLLL